ncbi:MAG: hypothetical protein HY231_20670 [Acidobacteria bacterium]|nr:hypothetical protein [Acidobacteriota bacterium]
MLKSHKWLWLWSAALLGAALILKFMHLSKPVVQLVGLAEILFAILTGILFGIKSDNKEL